MADDTQVRWRGGFSQRIKNWVMKNDSPPFSAEDYRQTDAVNRADNRRIMTAVFQRIDSNCLSDAEK